MLDFFSTKHRSLALVLVSLIIWGIIFSLSYLFPLVADNYLFSKDMHPGFAAFMTGEPITSLESMTLYAAWRQSILMYYTWCGRFIGNLFVYISFMLPVLARTTLSAVLFVCFCFLIHLNIFGKNWKKRLTAGSIFFIFAFVWVSMPSFGSAFFWVSVGGLPALVAQMLFLIPYRFALDSPHEQKRIANIYCILFFLFSICVSNLDYATSVAMPTASFVACAWLYYKRKSLKNIFFYVAGFLGTSLGAAITILAPGNACRMALTSDASVHEWIASSVSTRVFEYVINLSRAMILQCVPLLLIICSMWILRKYRMSIFEKIHYRSYLYIIPFIATHFAYFFTAWPPPRAFATTTMQMIVASSIVADNAIKILKKKERIYFFKYFINSIILICVVSVCIETNKFVEVHKIIENREMLFKSNKGKDVLVSPLPKNLSDRYMVLAYHLNDISFDKNFWVNKAIAFYYGLNSVALEQNIQKPCRIITKDINNDMCNVNILQKDNFLNIDLLVETKNKPIYNEIYIYYNGTPGLVSYIPHPFDNSVINFLSKCNDSRIYAVPILLCRANAKLIWEKNENNIYRARGKATLWGFYGNNAPIWIVQPGSCKYSLNLILARN